MIIHGDNANLVVCLFTNYYSVCFTEHCQPVNVVKSLLPCWNSLVFFEVSPVSFHQVISFLLYYYSIY